MDRTGGEIIKKALHPFDGQRADIPRYHLNLSFPYRKDLVGHGGRAEQEESLSPKELPCMPHRCNGRAPLTPQHAHRETPSRPQLPECNSTVTPPPSLTNRRLSGRVITAYWLPLIAFDGGIIYPRARFVKRFFKIPAFFPFSEGKRRPSRPTEGRYSEGISIMADPRQARADRRSLSPSGYQSISETIRSGRFRSTSGRSTRRRSILKAEA